MQKYLTTKFPTILISAIIVLSFLVSGYFFPRLPEQVITHWGMSGNPDGYSSKAIGAFMIPAMMLLLFPLFYFLPRVDPLKENYKSFDKSYYFIIISIYKFLLVIHVILLLQNIGQKFDFAKVMIVIFSALFIAIGFGIKDLKRNYFAGIRTPWTISSDEVWGKTHKFGSRAMILGGIVGLFGLIVPQYGFLFGFVPLVLSVLVTVLYSYLEWKKL